MRVPSAPAIAAGDRASSRSSSTASGVKNQLDASTNQIGLRIPTDILTEATLVTNGFSAKYGQAISGMVNVVTTDGGPEVDRARRL